MFTQSLNLKPQASGGEGQLVANYGLQRFTADWNNPSHRGKRVLAEFLGVAGLMVILSGVAAILARFAGAPVPPYQLVAIAAITSGTYLVAAIYFLGDISAHFDPVVTLAFGIRRDMSWGMVVLYWIAQFGGAVCGSLLIRSLVGSGNRLASTLPPPHMQLQAVIFEAVITFGLVLLVLSMANGPKLNGPLIPIAVGLWIVAASMMGGTFEGASMNPARSFGPAVATHHFANYWIYVAGPVLGALAAVVVTQVFRGGSSAKEAAFALGAPGGPDAPE
ncbi:MAG TPA: aquaporin [Solirubrobacteraceae bacterium]|jgi:glycerol uptake facilitator-like aquaporin